ncbi:MAG: hypothetical protein KAG61_06805 [Bacteriovoracaceae bacterium]|nr:hypothetical protein [Bacteriovoracaceae bacterium]
MSNKNELQDKINSIMNSNPVDAEVSKITKNKYLREVKFYQDELIHNNVLLPFDVLLSEIEEGCEKAPVGIHGHTRDLYCLRWEKGEEEKFIFSLENILAKKKRKLIDCPEEVIRDIYHLLPIIVELMAQKAQALFKEETKKIEP